MIEEVEKTGDARAVVKGILDRKEKLMGFGHRVYRAEDPRARVLRATAKRLEAPRYEVAAALEQAALAELRERRPDRAIETNVEFWAAVILDFAQVPTQMMPAMFTCGRTAGWCAHILEQKRLGKLVRPAAIYVGPDPRSPESVEGWDKVAQVVTTATFASAARSFAALVHEIPAGAWGEPGLGEWDVRSLVGHTSRSLTTVRTYLQTTAEREDITTPQEYYVRVTPSALGIDPADVAERGRQAGRDLGDDPAAAVDELVSGVRSDLASVDDPLIEVIGGLGIRLHTYLPTRIFELAVHGIDIAQRARHSVPAAGGGARGGAGRRDPNGHRDTDTGKSVLMALTGRSALPPSFSVV